MTMSRRVQLLFAVTAAFSIGCSTQSKINDVPYDKWEADIQEWNETKQTSPDFIINNAWLTIKSNVTADLLYYLQHDQCHKCPLQEEDHIVAEGNKTWLIQSDYGNYIDIRKQVNTTVQDIICSDWKNFLEKGDYWLIIFDDQESGITCDIVLTNNPSNVNLDILWAFLFFLGVAALWILLKVLYAKGVFQKCRCNYKSQDLDPFSYGTSTTTLELDGGAPGLPDTEQVGQEKQTETKEIVKRRLRSLDAFRGLSLMVMIFVNYGGGSYWFFQHVHWDGLLVADLVFPWFVFMMGTSMAFSIRSLKKRKLSMWKILYKITKRTILLFAIGFIIGASGVPDLSTIRIFNVLQRLSLAYFLTALTHITCAEGTDKKTDKWWSVIRDIVNYWLEWVIMLSIVALHCGLTFGLPVPDCPTGYLGPGGLHDGGQYFNCSGGAAGYIDRLILTPNHMYRWSVHKEIYQAELDFEPEGILGTLTTIFTCFLGLQAGKIIITYKLHLSRIVRWVIWGVLSISLGILLSTGTKYDGWVPINKNLWSLSFVFLLSGMAFLLLSFLYLLIDYYPVWTGAPCVYPGMNSITIYVVHYVFSTYFPLTWKVSEPGEHWQLFYQDLWGIFLLTLLAYQLYRSKTFISL